MSAGADKALGRALASEGAAYAAVEAGQQALGLLAVPVVFWYLTPSDFGLVTWALVLSQLATTVASGGLDFALLRHHCQGDADARIARQRVALRTVAWSSAGLAALAVIGVRWAPGDQRAALLLGVGAGLALALRALPVAVLRADGRLRQYSIVQVGGTLCQVLTQVAMLALGYGVVGYLCGYVVGAISTLPTAFTHYAIRPTHGPPGDDRTLVRYAAAVFPATLLNRAQVLADRALLVGFFGTASVGVYGAALRLATPVKLLSGGLKTALAPALSRAEEQPADRLAAAAPLARLMILSTLPLGAVVGLAGWCLQFTPWRADWLDLQRILGLLLAAQLLQSLAFVLQTLVYYGSAPGRASWIAGAQAVALVAALAMLVPARAALGAAASQLLAGIVAVAVAFLVLRRDTHFLPVARAATWPAVAFLPVVLALTLAGSATQLGALLACLAIYVVTSGVVWKQLHSRREVIVA